MNCEQAAGLVKPFIEGKIKDEELEGYLKHVCSCKDCYEELDIMYIVSEGLHGLQSNSCGSFNFTGMLAGRIAEGKRYLRRKKIRKVIFLSADTAAYLSVAAAALHLFGFI